MRTLRLGDRGDEVRELQKLLRLYQDGIFGVVTQEAVMNIQRKYRLVVDGVVGAKTWAVLDTKCVDPSVVYLPLKVHITKCTNRTIKYLAIHYTAGGASTKGSARSVKGVFEQRRASADFAVDDVEMVQFNPDIKNYYCWSVGDKKAAKVNNPDGKNGNTISIEICSSRKTGTTAAEANHEGWYFTDAAIDNAIRLAKILMKKYNIPIERVVRHYDISGKYCPGVVGWNDGRLYTTSGKLTTNYNNSKKWLAFKEKLSNA